MLLNFFDSLAPANHINNEPENLHGPLSSSKGMNMHTHMYRGKSCMN